mgnify:CR=1 FL=1
MSLTVKLKCQVLMSMGEAVCVSDEYGQISTTNPAFEGMFEVKGRGPKNYEGLHLRDLLDDRHAVQLVRDDIAGGQLRARHLARNHDHHGNILGGAAAGAAHAHTHANHVGLAHQLILFGELYVCHLGYDRTGK